MVSWAGKEITMEKGKKYAIGLGVAAVFFLLALSSEAKAGGVDFHVGIGLPFPGLVVAPPVVYAPPPVIVVPPHVYPRPVVVPHYRYYRPHHVDRHSWKHGDHGGHGRYHKGR